MPDLDLIAKYLAGEATVRETRAVEQWRDESSKNASLLLSLQKTIRPQTAVPDFQGRMESDWQKIVARKNLSSLKGTQKIRHFTQTTVFRIAATLLLLVVVGLGVWKFGFQTEPFPKTLAAADSVRSFELADGSKIWLNRHATLKIADDFGEDDRKVNLTGEGYFEVASDAKIPFIVNTGSIDTKVIGTAFNIKQSADRSVAITVVEGKVSVTKRSNPKEEFLLVGDAARYDFQSGQLVKSTNSDLNFLSWKTGVIRFQSATLKDVCAFLSGFYRLDLQADKSIAQNRITAVFDNLSSDEVVNVIMSTHDLTVRYEGSRIIFFSE